MYICVFWFSWVVLKGGSFLEKLCFLVAVCLLMLCFLFWCANYFGRQERNKFLMFVVCVLCLDFFYYFLFLFLFVS